jgi:hypothetical protein
MAATSQELALRYLLELSKDIRAALLYDRSGKLLAAAPGAPPGRVAELGAALLERAGALPQDDAEAVELDASCEGGAVFLIRAPDVVMLCLTERSVLPGLIFYDMHAILNDLDRAARAESRRLAPAGGGRGGR